jgi:hypothetical protein
VTEPILDGDYWRATASVFRKDMTRAFAYPGRYPAKGGNARFAPEMAIKVAEVMALRRAFDVSAPVVEERWDRDLPEAPVAPQTLSERVAQKRAEIAPSMSDSQKESATERQDDDDRPLLAVMPVEESEALPVICGNADEKLETGECELPPSHGGPHRNDRGVWPAART